MHTSEKNVQLVVTKWAVLVCCVHKIGNPKYFQTSLSKICCKILLYRTCAIKPVVFTCSSHLLVTLILDFLAWTLRSHPFSKNKRDERAI